MKAIVAVFVLLIFLCVLVCGGEKVFAASEVRWTDELPVVLRNTAVQIAVDTSCPTYFQDILIGTDLSKKRACMYDGATMRLGSVVDGGVRRAAIGFKYDAHMFALTGVCERVDCRYASQQDALIVPHYFGLFGRAISIYTHVSERVKRIVLPGTGGVGYELDADAPDYELKNDAAQYVDAGAYAVSENGQWLAVEVRSKGILLINMTTFEQRQVSTSGYTYDIGMDPSEEIAVSNDGRSITVTGLNAGFTVIDVVPGCGQPLLVDASPLPGAQPCPTTDLGIGNIFQNFLSAHRPTFDATGQTLGVVVTLRGQQSRSVTFGRGGSEVPSSIALLSLGDSFVSGEGETDESYYIDHTNESTDTCHISRRSYPFLLAASMRLAASDAKSVACAGARIMDITTETKDYHGQNNRVTGVDTDSGLDDVRQSALIDMWPGKVAQASFAEKYMPLVLTVSVGGNDAGLMGKLRVCAMPGATCEWAAAEGRSKTAGELKALFDRYVALFSELVRLSPSSRIYAIGYPDIINPDGVCDPVTTLLFTKDEQHYMRESLRYLNQVMASAATKAGVKYIDVRDGFEGGMLCDSLLPTAMNGIVLGNDAPLLSALPSIKVIGSGSFHPKPKGHEMISAYITGGYPSLTDYSWCGGTARACPGDASAPTAGEYWRVSSDSQVPRAHIDDFADILQSGRQLSITLPAFSVQPGSSARIEIHSDPMTLGNLSADSRGGISGNVTIPTSVEEGHHTLHLYGTGVDGGMIDVYQFVSIGGNGVAIAEGSSSLSSPPASVTLSDQQSVQGSLGGQAQAVIGTSVLGEKVGVAGSALAQEEKQGMRTVRTRNEAHRLGGNVWIWMAGLVGVLVLLMIILIMMRRRWVKRGGSV